MRQERAAVVKALRAGFGGDDFLFVSLWRSSGSSHESDFADQAEEDEEQDQADATGDEGDTEIDTSDNSVPEMEDEWRKDHRAAPEILNIPTEEKLAAYGWLTGGCEYLGPYR